MNKIDLKAPAKINLFLEVLRKREDNYHDIYSCFQAVDLFDNLRFKKRNKRNFSLTLEKALDLPLDDNNLIIKTAKLLFQRYNLSGGLDIFLGKNIPVAAGLAGGSTDAAATIYAINRLYDLGLSSNEMKKIGLEIGSDVPFFFSSGQANVTGRGEIIRDVQLPLDYAVVLISPPISVSTKDSYQNLNLSLTSSGSFVNFLEIKDFRELVAQFCNLGNDFEKNNFTSYPVLIEVKNLLNRSGAALTRMSGTGPSMFGLFKNMPEGGEYKKFTRGNWRVFFVHPITLPAWH